LQWNKEFRMKSPLGFVLAAMSVLAFAVPVHAQTAPVQTLTTVNGNVMVSGPGGSMVSATAGQTLAEGQTIVVGTGGTATVTTAAGTVTLTAGTYSIGAGGLVSAVATAAGTGTVSVASLAGGLSGVTGIAAGVSVVVVAGAYQAKQNSDSDGADDIIDPATSK
jgi:hypothetical protein